MGEYRPSADYPSQSAILGLLAAAFGIVREDEKAQRTLRNSYRVAVGVLDPGRLLRDFHTAQVPSRADLKKRPQATRRDELSLPKYELNTILSTRDYRQGAASLVALQAIDGAQYTLARIAEALRHPKFVLYLGRKSCPPAAPLHPLILDAASISEALNKYLQDLPPSALVLRRIAWGDDFGVDEAELIGRPRHLSLIRKDQVLARNGWQFGDRREHIALLEEE